MFEKLIVLFYYLKQKYQRRFKDRKSFERWQKKKATNFIRKIVKKSPFYEKLYRDFDLSDISTLPIITKKDMMQNFDTLNTVHIKKEEAFNIAYQAEKDRNFTPKLQNITVGLSSGTSGNRGLFLVSDSERRKWAGTVLAKQLPSSLFHHHKIAFFLRCDSNLYQSVKSRHVCFEYFDLLKPLQEHVDRLNQFQPTILVAPPSLLRLLVEQQNLHINPDKIISVAEVLEDVDRKIIESYFSKKLHQIYQTTEGFIASTCPYGTLHLNEDIIMIEKEFLDENRFIPIITDFNRKTQPILRYKLNDILTLKKEACPCGSHHLAIEKIEGRCDDIFYFKSLKHDKQMPVFPDFISRAIICSNEKVTDYYVRQMSDDKIEVYINQPDFDVQGVFKDLCQKLGCICPDITVLETKPTLVSGKKQKRIERCCDD